MNWRFPRPLGSVLAVAAVLLISGIIFVLLYSRSQEGILKWQVESGAPSQDLKDMQQAVEKVAGERPIPLPSDHEINLEGVKVEGDWAIAGGPVRNTKTGAIAGAEGAVVILRKVQDKWQAAYPGTPEYEIWLDRIPNTLLSPETKKFLR